LVAIGKEICEMNVSSIVIREEELTERLLAQQPAAKATLERLRVRFEGRSGYGAFAPIRNRGCGACKMTIDSQRLQRAQRGVFITCANCARFLYIAAVE
jgi:predicted  nucleic acid-binding Zn-ribbon protein